VTAERLRRDRRPGLFDFVSGLLDEKIDQSGFRAG
jgi:guanylate kinase